jgi:hypothetical protein
MLNKVLKLISQLGAALGPERPIDVIIAKTKHTIATIHPTKRNG